MDQPEPEIRTTMRLGRLGEDETDADICIRRERPGEEMMRRRK
jgi:hypothetical protein